MNKVYMITKKRLLQNNIRTALVIFVVLLMALLGLYSTYSMLLSNARQMGHELVKSFTADEERNIAVYRAFIEMSEYYLEEVQQENAGQVSASLQKKMEAYFTTTAGRVEDDTLACYAVIQGKVVVASGNGSLDDFDLTEDWYQEIKAADGEVFFTDELSGDEPDTIMAGMINPQTDNGILMKITRRNFEAVHEDIKLPERGAYYLCDSQGNLLYYDAPFAVDEKEIEAYAASIWQEVSAGSIAETGDDIIDLNGDKRGVYHNNVSNGWLCIMTIPHTTVLSGLKTIITIYSVVFGILFLVVLLMGLNDIRMNRQAAKNNQIISALCDTFYAVYRINLKEARYQMIKGSMEMQAYLPPEGTYAEMMTGFDLVVAKDLAEDLQNSFSLEHLRSLAKEHVTNYGGDFLRMMNGEEKWVNISYILSDSLGEDEAILAFRQIDLEKRRQLVQTQLLKEALDAADASERSQHQFFSNMSHEMRTPLNIILGMNELAMREENAVKRMDYQGKIENAAKEILRLINNILHISKVENALMPIDKKAFNIREAFYKIVQPFEETAKKEEKEFQIQTDLLDEMVIGDTLKLTQILNNILSNAIHFTAKGDKISVTMRQAGTGVDNYIFIIEDTGIGMAESFLPRVFEPYAQEKRFTDHRAGDGMGMTIVKNLVTQKGGHIEIESTLGEGTRVVVTLPFPKETEEADLVEDMAENCLQDLRVMVVDDIDLNRELLCELLEDEGAIVTPAEDGQQAVELFQEAELFSYDVIIMDRQMPVMDGCQAASAIRRLDRADAKWVLIIALTANSDAADVAETVQAGMNAHLTKPADVQKIRLTVNRLLLARERGNIRDI